MRNGATLRLSVYVLVCLAIGTARGQTIIYVDANATGANNGSSWGNAYVYLQDALAAASAPAEMRVAQGTYTPDRGGGQTPGDRTATFQVVNGVAIKGGYGGSQSWNQNARDFIRYETILSGDLSGNDVGDLFDFSRNENSCTVMTTSGTDGSAVLDGVTIASGHAVGFGPCDPQDAAGLYINNGSPTMANCIFRWNYAYYNGGAIYNDAGSPTLADCKFIGNMAGYEGGAIFNRLGSPTLFGCSFSANYSDETTGAGMHTENGSPTLTNCVFNNNQAFNGPGGALSHHGSGDLTLTNCTFFGNKGAGITFWNTTGAITVVNSVLWGNFSLGPYSPELLQIFYNQSGNPDLTVTHSCIEGLDTLAGNGNIGDDPLFVNPRYWTDDTPQNPWDDVWVGGDYRLQEGSPCIDAADNTVVPPDTLDLDDDADTAEPTPFDLDGNPRFVDDPHTSDTGAGTPPVVDMGAYEYRPPLYVDDTATGANDGSSWCDSYIYLQDALAAAAASDGTIGEIRVAQGTYRPDQGAGQTPGDQTGSFQLLDGVPIEGGYAGCGAGDPDDRDIATYETILSGDLNGDDGPGFANNEENSYHVVTVVETDASTVIDGFTIAYGNASDSSPDSRGGGLNTTVMGGITVRDCRFHSNAAAISGGGMFIEWGYASLTRCTFEGNTAGAAGGGFKCSQDTVSVVTANDCRFFGNTAGFEGGGWQNGEHCDSNLFNCVFSGNSAEEGGGIGFGDVPTQLTAENCSFWGNHASSEGGGALAELGWEFTNCAFWGNSDAGGMDESAQLHAEFGCMANYNCIQGWTGALGGTGNMDANPLFKDSDGPDDIPGTDDDNLRLSTGSQCIDAGDNTAVPPDRYDLDDDGDLEEHIPFDLDGNPRFVDDICTDDDGDSPIVDMGAYEFQSVPEETTIGDRVWADLDRDGIQGDGEPGIPSVLVYLYDEIGTLRDFAFTGAGGEYAFANVPAALDYLVRFIPSPGYLLSDQDQGDDDELDSDADPITGYTQMFQLCSLEDTIRWDAGMMPQSLCVAPDEPIYLYAMTLDTNDHPVLHFMDPNQPAHVTGYNIYRVANASLPWQQWTKVASDVIDMDEATPNKQWVDISGQDPPPPANVWFYQVTAYNGPPCDVEGPFGWPVETDCGNGLDEDLDTLVDCADPDCANACDPLPIELGDTWRYFKGTQEPSPYDPAMARWAQPEFNDYTWTEGASGFGYGTDCASLHGTLLDDMQHNYVSVYVRIPFRVEDPSLLDTLTLSLDYDDGWVAYLNGEEIERSPGMGGTPGVPPTHDQTTATGDHECSGSPGAANPPEDFDLSGAIGLLVPGTNVLAIQGHNRALVSSDFSLIPTLSGTE